MTEATLETFGERLTRGEAEDLAVYLPEEAETWLVTEEPVEAEEFGIEEFVRRVANREGVDEDRAREHAAAVAGVVREVVSDEELDRAFAQLPSEYGTLFAEPDQ